MSDSQQQASAATEQESLRAADEDLQPRDDESADLRAGKRVARRDSTTRA